MLGWRRFGLLALAVMLLAGCWVKELRSTPTPYSVLDPTTALPTATASATMTYTPSPTATRTSTPTATPTVTPTFTLTPEPPTATPVPTAPPTETPLPTPTATPVIEPTPDGIARVLQVPILMYHYISEAPAESGRVRRDLSVPPDRFREHLRMLHEAGYETVSLRQLVLALQVGQPLPPNPIIITFDDGYRDNYTNAFPILKDEGMRGSFFVITGALDQDQPEYLSWDMVVEMHAAGMEIGSHSYAHVDLAGQSDDYLIFQLLGSREAIEARINEPVRVFCYPSGSYDDHTIDVLKRTNYWAAVTVGYGVEQRSDSLYELQRIRVRGTDSAADLLRRITAAHGPQSAIGQHDQEQAALLRVTMP